VVVSVDDVGSGADHPGLVVTDDVLRRALSSLRDLLVIVDGAMRIAYVSPSVGAVMGYAPEQLIGRTLRDVIHQDEHAVLEQLIGERFASRAGGVIVHRSPHADGGFRYLETMIQLLDEDGRFIGAAFSARDVTQRVAEQLRLEREVAFRGALVALTNELLGSMVDARFYQHALERAVEIVPDAQAGSILLSLGDGGLRFEAAVGYDLDALQQLTLTLSDIGHAGEPRTERVQGHAPIGLERQKLDVLERVGRRGEIRVTLSVPITLAGEIHGLLNLDHFDRDDAFDDDDRATAEAIAAQVSAAVQRRVLEAELQAEHARFERLATHDALTELPNRRLFLDRLGQALAAAGRKGRRVALLFIDLDGFKQVNDRHGHEVGDALLRQVAARMATSLRAEDTVARLGGDEFGALLIDVQQVEDAVVVAHKLLAATEGAPAALGIASELGASIGVALFPDDGDDADALLRAADDAMYRVKSAGKLGVRVAGS
jgi:diguanylate cyclase (GGDEF)-like protein/PAS domain S-box-containing protein